MPKYHTPSIDHRHVLLQSSQQLVLYVVPGELTHFTLPTTNHYRASLRARTATYSTTLTLPTHLPTIPLLYITYTTYLLTHYLLPSHYRTDTPTLTAEYISLRHN